MEEYRFSILDRTEHFVLYNYYRQVFQSSQWKFAFPDGTVDDPHKATALLLDPGTIHTVVTVAGRILGVARLEGFSGKMANIHFSFLPGMDGGRAVEIGELYLDWLFNGTFELTTLLGIIPRYNFPAIAFSRKLGFQKLGVLENGGCNVRKEFFDLVLMKLVKNEAENKYV